MCGNVHSASPKPAVPNLCSPYPSTLLSISHASSLGKWNSGLSSHVNCCAVGNRVIADRMRTGTAATPSFSIGSSMDEHWDCNIKSASGFAVRKNQSDPLIRSRPEEGASTNGQRSSRRADGLGVQRSWAPAPPPRRQLAWRRHGQGSVLRDGTAAAWSPDALCCSPP